MERLGKQDAETTSCQTTTTTIFLCLKITSTTSLFQAKKESKSRVKRRGLGTGRDYLPPLPLCVAVIPPVLTKRLEQASQTNESKLELSRKKPR